MKITEFKILNKRNSLHNPLHKSLNKTVWYFKSSVKRRKGKYLQELEKFPLRDVSASAAVVG